MKRVHVPADVQMRVQLVLQQCIKRAEAHYKQSFAVPTVHYDKSGRTAGVAHYHSWSIDINSVLLMENLDNMIANTVPHELAHLITFRVYPETWQGRERVITRSGRIKREPREVHGPRFYEVCDVIGMTAAGRTHNYDTTNSRKQVDKTLHLYRCLACNVEFNMTAKRHAMQINGTRRYKHRCGGPIAPVERIKLQMIGTQPIVHVEQKSVHNGKMGPTGDSKLAKCWALFKRWHGSYNRQQMIAVFYQEADCTSAGASTYYAKCQQLYREGYI